MKRCPQCQGACWDAHKHCPACGANVEDVEITEGDPLIGVTVGGKFVLKDVLGEGAMGKVYRADQTNLGRTVAVKIMNPVLATDEGLVRRFIDEARSASRLNHPNIVSVIDFGQTESGVLYIVMEFLRGRTLARMIAEEAPLPSNRITSILGQVLDALDEAHGAEVVHRDLKPDNIMVEPLRTHGDFAKVLDFGIAKLRREDRDFETVDGQCGTPEYMAPEQVRGQDDVDGRADLYSLGIVMYEMLTGLTPFAGGSHAEVFTKQLNYAPKPPRQARTDVHISEAMEGIVLRALEKDRDDRYQSAAEMKSALEEALDHEMSVGRGTPVRGFAAQAPAAVAQKPAKAPEPEGKFPLPPVPRPEWPRMGELLAAVSGASLSLVGADGAGKTSLVAHVRRLAEQQGRAGYWVGPDPTGAMRPWFPVRRLCRELLGLTGTPSLPLIEAAIQRIGLDASNVAGMAELFGVAGDFSGLEHQTRRRECLASALQAVQRAASQKPALLVFEDVERFDAPSRELVDRLLEVPGSENLVAIATRTPEAQSNAAVDALTLLPLGEQQVRDLARHALGEATSTLVHAVMEASLGLPLHVEQLLRYIAEGGGEPYPNLSDTIGQRIARLPQEARTILQAVAVCGGEASDSLLRTIEVNPTPEGLEILSDQGFAVAAHGVVRIVHPLFSDVAYGGIPEEARRALHAHVWRALEGQKMEPAVLGRHAYEARDRRAIPILERAGERATREFDDAGAAVHFRRAVELQRWALMEGAADAEEAFVRLSVKLGEALFYSKDMVGAEGVLREALGYAQGSAQAESRVRLALARLYIAWDQLERAERELRGGLRVAFKAGDSTLLAELYYEFGGLCVRRGDLEAAIDELSEGITLCTGGEGAEADVGPGVLWRLIARHAETLQQAGDAPAALAVARHALRHAQRVQSLVGEARVHTLFAQLHDMASDTPQAQKHRAMALDMMRRLGDRRATAELLIADAQSVLQAGGMRRDTITRLQEASQLAAQVGWREGVEKSEQVIRANSSVPPKTQSLAPQRTS